MDRARMRPARVSARAASADADAVLTPLESTFRNPKFAASLLVAYKTAADLAAKAAMFVVTVLAARQLPPRAFGVFAVATTIGWLVAVASDFGLQLHLARAVARAPQEAAALLARWRRPRLATAAAGIGVVAAALAVAGASREIAIPILLVAIAYAVTGVVEFLSYLFRGLSRSDLESTVVVLQRTATVGGAAAALTWWPGLNGLAIAMLVPAAGALAWAWRRAASLTRDRSGSRDLSGGGGRDATPLRAEFAADVAPIGAGVLLSALYFRVDVLLVQWWAGTDAVARYNAVFRLIDALRLFPAAVLAVMLPALCRADGLGALSRAAATVAGFGIAAALMLWPAADRIVVMVYGPAYRPAVPALRILALAVPLMALNYALTSHLVARHRQRAYAGACAGALAVNLALNARLIPAMAIEGAAWATVGTEIALTFGCLAALFPRS